MSLNRDHWTRLTNLSLNCSYVTLGLNALIAPATLSPAIMDNSFIQLFSQTYHISLHCLSAGAFAFIFRDGIEAIRREHSSFHHTSNLSALVIMPSFPFSFNGWNIPVLTNSSHAINPTKRNHFSNFSLLHHQFSLSIALFLSYHKCSKVRFTIF